MKYFYLFLIFCCFSLSANLYADSSSPATEIRAVWLATNWKLDWPQKGETVEEQKKEMVDLLDKLAEFNINLVFFQVRAQGKAFYNSNTMDKSPYYNSKDNFDPLAFAIQECHKRQMECHAWMTTFPVERIDLKNKTKPTYYKRVNGYWFLDPARPETRKMLKDIVAELVTNYNIDGIHLDYIRYPDNKKWLDDNDSYQKYSKGKSKENWRRENVNKLVADIYDLVKEKKNWVQVSSSPIGKYKRIHNEDKWTSYEDVSQDPIYWLANDKQDLIFPMMYYGGEGFMTHYQYWTQEAKGRYVVPGLGLHKISDKSSFSEKDIIEELEYLRNEKSAGVAFFRAEQIISNETNIQDYLRKTYRKPAKLPPLYWLDNSKNNFVPKLEARIKNNGKLLLSWSDNGQKDMCYNIYVSTNKQRTTQDGNKLLVTNFRGTRLEIDYPKGEYGMYYYITSSNRYHTESNPSKAVFFIHSNTIFK